MLADGQCSLLDYCDSFVREVVSNIINANRFLIANKRVVVFALANEAFINRMRHLNIVLKGGRELLFIRLAL